MPTRRERASERARARALAPRNETSLQKYSLLTNVEGARQQGGRRGEDVDILSFSRATKWNSGEADPRTGARSVRSMKFYSVTMKHVPLQPILAGYSRLLEDNKENCPLSLSLSLSLLAFFPLVKEDSCRSTLLTDERFDIEPPQYTLDITFDTDSCSSFFLFLSFSFNERLHVLAAKYQANVFAKTGRSS